MSGNRERRCGAGSSAHQRAEPKTIVVSGARSNVGKTALARRLSALLPGAVHVKLGHGRRKRDADNVFYPAGTPFERIAAENGDARFLIIESNRILGEIDPDCAIYLPADDPKPSAAAARRKADLVRGEPAPAGATAMLARRLGLPVRTVREIMQLSGAAARDVERKADGTQRRKEDHRRRDCAKGRP